MSAFKDYDHYLRWLDRTCGYADETAEDEETDLCDECLRKVTRRIYVAPPVDDDLSYSLLQDFMSPRPISANYEMPL